MIAFIVTPTIHNFPNGFFVVARAREKERKIATNVTVRRGARPTVLNDIVDPWSQKGNGRKYIFADMCDQRATYAKKLALLFVSTYLLLQLSPFKKCW